MTTCIALRHLSFEDAGILEDILAARGIELSYIEVGLSALNKAALTDADLTVLRQGGNHFGGVFPFCR